MQQQQWSSVDGSMPGSPNKPAPVDVVVEKPPAAQPQSVRRMMEVPVDVIDVPVEVASPGGRFPSAASNGRDRPQEVSWRVTATSNQRVPAVGSGAAPRDQRASSPRPEVRPVLYDNSAMIFRPPGPPGPPGGPPNYAPTSQITSQYGGPPPGG